MSVYRDQVVQVLRAVRVTSRTTYAWFGRGSHRLPRALAEAMSPDATREHLVGQLGDELYRSFYTQGRPVPRNPDVARPDRSDDALVDELSRANGGKGGWDAGWRVKKVSSAVLVLERNGLRVRAASGQCRPRGGAPAVGEAVILRRPHELRAASPGFYTAIGDGRLARGGEGLEVRVYFNVAAAGAVPLVASCTRLLNDAEIPFQLKVVDHPMGFSRCDTAVLYLDGDGFDEARESLNVAVSACASHLRASAPAFTGPLTRGVAVGEHRPGLGSSFGSSRCRLLAEGIAEAYERGITRLEDRLDVIARQFAASGLDLEAPYLAPLSASRYEL